MKCEIRVDTDRNELNPWRYSLDDLITLGVAGLYSMFDEERQLFNFKIRKSDTGVVREGHSLRYTIISLLGLHRLAEHTGLQPVDIKSVARRLVDNASDLKSIGDFGLLLWLCALTDKGEFERLYTQTDIARALECYEDGRAGLTTELSWLLIGLAYYAKNNNGSILPGMEEIIMRLFDIIRGNYGGRGIFGHRRSEGAISNFRSRIGCFADQVYPLYAFSIYGSTFANSDALEIVRSTADRICELQGPLGQWWWHYNASTGNVAGRYPVYSVHQDGMAPMALFAAGLATGRDYNAAIYKGLSWIMVNNELNNDMVDTEHNVIWRNIHRTRIAKYAELACVSLTGMTKKGQPKDLSVLYECWSYHLGWLLYAFADKTAP